MTKAENDRYGIPLLGNLDKAKALVYCIEHGAMEDALGHALDLVERLRRQCRRQCRQVYKDKSQDKAFTIKALRKCHHVRQAYEDYRVWLKREARREIAAT
jgi:hypothetical protein